MEVTLGCVTEELGYLDQYMIPEIHIIGYTIDNGAMPSIYSSPEHLRDHNTNLAKRLLTHDEMEHHTILVLTAFFFPWWRPSSGTTS